jgi:hypothetical protein
LPNGIGFIPRDPHRVAGGRPRWRGSTGGVTPAGLVFAGTSKLAASHSKVITVKARH